MFKRMASVVIENSMGIGALIASIALPVVIFYVQHNEVEAMESIERLNRDSRLTVQIAAQREQSDAHLKAEMFKALVEHLLGEELKDDPDRQILALHLLALNFQDHFDAKPLFESLDQSLSKKDPRDVDRQLRLRQLAFNIAERQEAYLREFSPVTILDDDEVARGFYLCTRPTSTEDCPSHRDIVIRTEIDSKKGGKGSEEQSAFYRLELVEVNEIGAAIRFSNNNRDDAVTNEWNISIYAMPYTDNLSVAGGNRVAFRLKKVNIEDGYVNISLVSFPEAFISAVHRPPVEELVKKIRVEKDSE